MLRLVADVGGTNTRLALSQSGILQLNSIKIYRNADWEDLYAVIADFLSQSPSQPLGEMVVAVAGPVHGRFARLTNRDWLIETGKLAALFHCAKVQLLNDLTALGYSVPALNAEHLKEISPGEAAQKGISQSLVIGLGTGFNVSPVLQTGATVLCPAAEAGHITLPSGVCNALAQIALPSAPYPTVEHLFSGRGLTAYIQTATGDITLDGTAAIKAYGTPQNETITKAIDNYSALLGWLLRDLTLSYMALSGLYLAGSVARAVITYAPAPCVSVFNQPCHIRNQTRTPIFAIEDDCAALFGCAGYSQF